MDSFALTLFFALIALFVIRAWKTHGRLSVCDRWALITSFTVAATTFFIAPLLINWVIVPTAVWFLAVALLTGGVVGAVRRWPELTWFIGTHPLRRSIGIAATLVICALLIGVAMF